MFVPANLKIELTTQCNLNCVFCPYRENSLLGFMAMDLLEIIARQLPELGPGLEVSLFTIGEPLMHPAFDQAVSVLVPFCSPHSVVLATNGLLLNGNYADSIIESGIFRRLYLSVDAASSAVYSSIRRGGDFFRLKENIIEFLKKRAAAGTPFPFVDLQMVVVEENEREASDFVAFWTSTLSEMSLEPLIGKGSPSGDRIVLLPHVAGTTEEQHQSDARFLRMRDSGLAFEKGTLAANPGGQRQPCGFLYDLMAVNFNGNVTPCCIGEQYGRFVIGNARHDRLLSIWNSEVINSYRFFDLNGDYAEMDCCRHCFQMSREFVPECALLEPEREADLRRHFSGMKYMKRCSVAGEAFIRQEFERAENLFNACVAFNPYPIEPRKHLAICRQILGRNEDALEIFRSVLDGYPDDLVALKGEAYCLQALGRTTESRDRFLVLLNRPLDLEMRREILEFLAKIADG
ncbi:MAG: radical SAM protein [Candidatus Wallbacteria bacterium]|nr:radical SAM protein [Candidatus Wallbacteria bacterium]